MEGGGRRWTAVGGGRARLVRALEVVEPTHNHDQVDPVAALLAGPMSEAREWVSEGGRVGTRREGVNEGRDYRRDGREPMHEAANCCSAAA